MCNTCDSGQTGGGLPGWGGAQLDSGEDCHGHGTRREDQVQVKWLGGRRQ